MCGRVFTGVEAALPYVPSSHSWHLGAGICAAWQARALARIQLSLCGASPPCPCPTVLRVPCAAAAHLGRCTCPHTALKASVRDYLPGWCLVHYQYFLNVGKNWWTVICFLGCAAAVCNCTNQAVVYSESHLPAQMTKMKYLLLSTLFKPAGASNAHPPHAPRYPHVPLAILGLLHRAMSEQIS